jgi:acyl dehydratase
MPRGYYEDFEVGERRTTPGRTITEGDITSFAGLSGDWHQLHTDVTYAAATPFGERIAHGMLVLSIGSALAFRLGQYEVLPKSFIAFYGMEEVRFTAPVKIGDTIHLEMEVCALEPKGNDRGIVATRNEILNQHDQVVCTFTTKILCGRQPR